MSADGLIEMPPVSNVMPLPTSTTGFAFFGALRYSNTMNRGGSSLPRVTDRNEPMPSFSMALRSSTFTFRPWALPMRWASSPSQVGVQWLPGRLAHSRASVTPAAMASPCFKPAFTAACAETSHSRLTLPGALATTALGLVWL